MALSRLAREYAAEIKNHDWSDAPWRIDRAGHQRDNDPKSRRTRQLDPDEADRVKVNVMWVTAQVLGHADPNFDVHEYAQACDVTGFSRGTIEHGLRRDGIGNLMSGLQ